MKIINAYKQSNKILLKYYSTKSDSEKFIKFTDTINLPKTKFPLRLSQAKREEIEINLIKKCFSKLYEYQLKHKNEPAFVLHDGPPYANGDLHIGHAVNKILKDITLRKHVINNTQVHYVPGWDCHGLPIELKAIKNNYKLSPNVIREKSRNFVLNTIKKQKVEFESWGVMANWSNDNFIYRTVDANCIENQLNLFFKLYQKKLIYRDLKPVYWSPSSRTALAEAELEYDPNFLSPSIYLRMKLCNLPNELQNFETNDIYALIWTTTPWTIPSNQGICYNKDLDYCLIKLKSEKNHLYIIALDLIENFQNITNIPIEICKKFKGVIFENCKYKHPIDGTELKFYNSAHVENATGTGLVHTAPAHGTEDFLISLKYKMPVKCLVDEAGQYTSEAPSFLFRKNILDEGNNLVMKYLEKDIIYKNDYIHSYPIDWRTKKPIILRASEQWFINTNQLKSEAIEKINQISFYPKSNSEAHKTALITQIQKRPYWCISRQRVWGVPIPVLYNIKTKEIVVNEKLIKHICSLVQSEGNIDFWWTKNLTDLIPSKLQNELNINIDDIQKGGDIFDIWFDSGITWFNALENDKIADLYLEGIDQFTGWFQSSLLTSIACRNQSPYKCLFVHGFTVDEKGHKMSKSLGNIIAPKDVIKKYGTDTLRWWVASHATQHISIAISENILKSSSETLNKIRAILRYLNGFIGQKNNQLERKECNFHHLDKYLLNSLYKYDEEATILYSSYDYNRVTSIIQNFISNQISSIYINLTKDRLYCGTDNDFYTVSYVLQNCYEILCKSLWPIIPFTIEESWSYYDTEPFYTYNIEPSNDWKNEESENLINLALDMKKLINRNYKDINSWLLDCKIESDSINLENLIKLHKKLGIKFDESELCYLLQVSSITINVENSCNLIDLICTNIESGSLCPRCRRYLINNNEIICKRCNQVIKNKK